jgi:hypothetical protein
MRSLFAALAIVVGAATPAFAATIVYNDFSSTAGLQLNGAAAAAVDGSARNVLRVTPATEFQSGSVFSTTAIQLGSGGSFSTKFSFNFNAQDDGFGGADGLVFVVQNNNTTIVGDAGGGMGYGGIGASLGIEFDNFNNGQPDDPNESHVGIDLNGSVTSVLVSSSPAHLALPEDRFVWIDYDGLTGNLEVRLSDFDARPLAALLTYNVDLEALLGGTSAFVGFTSGTGSAFANHDVIAWEFDSFVPAEVPEPSALVVIGSAVLGVAALRRRRRV